MNVKKLFMDFIMIFAVSQQSHSANPIVKDTIPVNRTANYIKFLSEPYKTDKSLTAAIAHARASLDAIAKLSGGIVEANGRPMLKRYDPMTDTHLLHEKFLKLLSDCYGSLFHPFMLAPSIDAFYPEYKFQLLTIAIDPKHKQESLQQIAEILRRMDDAWHLYADLLCNGTEHIQVKLNWSDYKMSISDWRSLTGNNAAALTTLPIVRKLTAMELWLLRSWHKAQRYALSWVI